MALEPEVVVELGVVEAWKVGAEVDAAGFFAEEGGLDHDAAEREHVLEFPAAGVVELAGEDVAPPAVNGFESVFEQVLVAADAAVAPHEAFEGVADVGEIERIGRRGDDGVFEWIDAVVVGFFEGDLGGGFAGVGTIDEAFEQAVGGEAIRAVQATR